MHRLRLIRPSRAALAAHARQARWLGIVLFAVALALLAAGAGLLPGPATGALGGSLVALGVAYAGVAFAADGAQARGLLAAVGAAYGVCGSLLLTDPVLGPLLLLAAVSTVFVLGGLAQAITAVVRPHAQSASALAAGLLIAALGAAVGLEWPLPAVPALGIAFGLAAAAQAAACFRLALAGERLAQRNLFGLRKNPSTRQPSGARATWRLPPGRQT
jgi:uncharacterized membrane protein HdeD (DUF308 family)